MDIRPIHNDDDHRVALAEIETLWDAPEGSDDAIKLDLLCGLPQLIRLDQKLRRNFPRIVDSIDHLGRECALP